MSRANTRDQLGLDLVPLAIATVLASAAGYLVASQVASMSSGEGEVLVEIAPASVGTVQTQQTPGLQP